MFGRSQIIASAFLLGLAVLCWRGLAHGGGVGVSRPAHPSALTGGEDTVDFRYYRVPNTVSPRAHRDLEFLWSRNYAGFGRPLDSVYVDGLNELDHLGQTICDVPGTNPFGFPMTDVKMVYDYFNRRIEPEIPTFRDSIYNSSPSAQVAFKVLEADWNDPDRQHVDVYVYLPKFEYSDYPPGYAGDAGYTGAGRTPSAFFTALEDTSTGHFGPPYVWSSNSVMIGGPHPGGVGRADPAERWTKADTTASWAFNHEFQHVINYRDGLTAGTAVSELFSSAAETIAGESPQEPEYEVPYSWSLLRKNFAGTIHNYQAWRGFGSYLAFQFRGTDTMSTGRADDLLWRWSGKPGGGVFWPQLADRLSPAECDECTLKTYLRNLSPVDRRELVVHNWRVASFVNSHDLAADHQYGFVPHLGFDPIRDLRAWQSFDGIASDDSVSVPHEITLQLGHVVRDISHSGGAADQAEVLNPRSTTLERWGADYWVVRSGNTLGNSRRPLVVEVRPEGYCTILYPTRLMASLILYGQQDLENGQPDSLWKHPEWALGVIGPYWVDAVPGAEGLELVVPNFGDSTKAVVIVVSLGYVVPGSETGNGISSTSASVRYRLNVGFRTGTYLAPNPRPVYSEPTWDDAATFSPSGDTLAFAAFDPEVSQRRLYRAPVAGGMPGLLVQPPGGVNEDRPDWSPRGDWVAFDREVAPSQSDIWAYSLRGLGLRQLTSSSLHDYGAAFNPNGQRLAYVRVSAGGGREVRVVSIAGTGDSLLVSRGITSVTGPRWAPDGRHVYFVANDTLYAVELMTRGVVDRGYVSAGTRSFDLPLGAERVVYEHVWREPACESASGAWTRRVVLRDTLTGREESAFYRPGIRTVSPRWSLNGTRLAFATNPLPADSCDVRVGQVRNNHAPLLHDVAQFHEMDVYAHVPFSYDFSASDSDGEAITFQGVYLPDSATFDPSSGLFSWPNPKQNGADDLYFIVFRALDPSGGVHSYVTRFRVLPQAPGGGGCPFVDVNTADGWITDNSILGRSRTGEPGLDAYRLKRSPDTRGNRIRLRIRENENELTTLDQVRLLAVDRAPTLTLLSAGGELHWGTRVPAWRVTTSKGEDITNLVTGAVGSLGWQGSPGDTVLVEMTDPATGRFGLTGTQDGGGGTGEGSDKEVEIVYDPTAGGGRYAASPAGGQSATPAALTDALWLDQTGIRVQVPDGTGSWQDLTHWYPREHNDEVYFPGLTQPQARLIFVGRHRLTFFGRLKPASGAVTQTPLSPLTATHTRLGDARDAVGVSETTTELAPGDTLKLEFEVPPPVEGLVREYFLVTRGVYTSDVPAARLRPQAPAAPSRYALLQNVPNPFAGTTAIQFELPRAERVKLEVFDLLGRRVRTLAEGEWPAGYHAVEWDRTSDAGTRLRAGVYLYRLTAGSFRDQKKMVIGAR